MSPLLCRCNRTIIKACARVSSWRTLEVSVAQSKPFLIMAGCVQFFLFICIVASVKWTAFATPFALVQTSGNHDRRSKSDPIEDTAIEDVAVGQPRTGQGSRVTDSLSNTDNPLDYSLVTSTTRKAVSNFVKPDVPRHRPNRSVGEGLAMACRPTTETITVKRKGCKKNVNISMCEGMCKTSTTHEFVHKHMLKVNYHDTCCRPGLGMGDIKEVLVDMNDEECQRQRSARRKSESKKRKWRGKFKNITLHSAVRCVCVPSCTSSDAFRR